MKIIDDGSCIRIEQESAVLVIAKAHIKTIDILHENIVRIDIGEGVLKSIYANYRDVTDPTVGSAAELRDSIKAMIASIITGTGGTEPEQLNFLKDEPIYIDESSAGI